MKRPGEKIWKRRASFGFGWFSSHFAGVIFVRSIHYLFRHDFRSGFFMETSQNTVVAHGRFGASNADNAAAWP
jgi:hypothetical protein